MVSKPTGWPTKWESDNGKTVGGNCLALEKRIQKNKTETVKYSKWMVNGEI